MTIAAKSDLAPVKAPRNSSTANNARLAEARDEALTLAQENPAAIRFLNHLAGCAVTSGGGAPDLRSLPLEVYQAVLSAQDQTMRGFFDAWATSIAENARRDRAQSRKAEQSKAEVARMALSNELFATAIKAIAGKGPVGKDIARTYTKASTAPSTEKTPELPPRHADKESSRPKVAPTPPDSSATTGVQGRDASHSR